MLARRTRRQWALADQMRCVERVHDVVAAIANPLPESDAADKPVRPTPAAADSGHILARPDPRLPPQDAAADASAVCGIPALLNQPGDDDDDDDGGGAAAAYAPEYAEYAYQSAAEDLPPAAAAVPDSAAPQEHSRVYHTAHHAVHAADPVPAAAVPVPAPVPAAYSAAAGAAVPVAPTAAGAAAGVSAGDYAYYQGQPGYHAYHHQHHHASDEPPAGSAMYGVDGCFQHQQPRHREAEPYHAPSHSRVADLVHPGPEPAVNAAPAQAAAYYGAPSKRELPEYDAAQAAKRQRAMHQSTTWPPATDRYEHTHYHQDHHYQQQQQHQQHQGPAAWGPTDPSSALPPTYAYSHHSHHYAAAQQHPQQQQQQQHSQLAQRDHYYSSS
ncbi:hypothetical protein H4R18_004089, partial [Coemansia javaensis]